MELDDILKKIGQMGRAQIILYILLGLLGIPCGMQNLGMVFMGASVDHWCDVPALHHVTPEKMQALSAVDDASTENGMSSCEIYDFDYTKYDVEMWNRSVFLSLSANKTVKKCSSWYFDKTVFKSTVRTRWNLVCSLDYYKQLMQSVYMCGFLLGTITFGVISDRIGRLKTLMITLLLQILFAIIAAAFSMCTTYANLHAVFTTVRFLVGMATGGLFTVAFVLTVELQAPKWRTYTGLFYQGFFAMGFCLLPGVAYALRDLLHIQLVMSLPFIVLLSYYWFVPESPRWLIERERYEEAEKIIRRIASFNKRPLADNFNLKDSLLANKTDDVDKDGFITDVLKRPRLRVRLFICGFCWFVSGMGYYGISNSADKLKGDIFITTLISALVEYPAYIACFFLVGQPRIGRRYSMAGCFVLTGISLCACIPLLEGHDDLSTVLVVLANVGKLGISAAFAIVYIFTAEIFPTVVRTASVGACSMCARIGALLEPQIRLLWDYWFGLPYLIFGILALVGGVLTLLLPESNNTILPQTIDDGEAFGTEAYQRMHHLDGRNGFDSEKVGGDGTTAEMNLINSPYTESNEKQ